MKQKKFHNVENYRSSMVTAIGIILGFVLGFSATWAVGIPADAELDWSDYSIGLGLFFSVALQLMALYRILDNQESQKDENARYHRTLQLFVVGVTLAFAGLALSIIQIFIFG
jgi:hypothetical protein